MKIITNQKNMKALVYNYENEKEPISVKAFPKPIPKDDEVLVKLKAAAINRRDYYIMNRAPYTKEWGSFIPGSDGSGIVEQLGSKVVGWKEGDEVLINPFLSCGECFYCKAGDSALCLVDEDLGGPRNGTFAEYITIPARNLILKPNYLTFEESASLPLALGTAWRVLMSRAKLEEGETLLIQGIGSGVATMMLQLAVAKGSLAIVTSGSYTKIERALNMGAIGGVNYKLENVVNSIIELSNGQGVDVAVDSSGKDSFKNSVSSLRKGGRIISFGITTGVMDINFFDLISKQASVITSNMFGKEELEEAINFYTRHELRPIIQDVFALEDVLEALKQLQSHSQFGKLVIRV